MSGLGLATAFRTLTRFPVFGKDSSEGRSLYWFPLVGLFLGACSVLISLIPLPLMVDSGLVLAFGAWATRGFHYDGLMDTADGFGGGWSVERRLEIMKDSHVGSFGVLALVLVLIVQFAALCALLATTFAPVILLFTPMAGRSMQVLASVLLPYARKQGTAGNLVREAKVRHLVVVLLWDLCFFVLAGCPAFLAWSFLATVGFTLLLCRSSWRHIRGVTGDVLGAVEVLSSTCMLVVSLAFVA